MRFSLRAVIAIAMLIGFYVLVVGVAAGLVVGEALLLWNQPISGIYLGIFAVPAFFALLGALITIERAEQDDVVGDLVTANPDDPHLAVVDAEAWVRLAWEIRGTAPDEEAAVEHLRGFHRVLRRAEQAAEHAIGSAPDDPTPWWSLTMIATGLSYDHERFDEIWDGLTARAPLHREGHDRALGYWSERWCGSAELMSAFAERAAGTSPLFAALPLHVALESVDDPGAWRTPVVLAALDAFLARGHLDDKAAVEG